MIGWLPLALFGHLANAAAFIIDKTLLTSSFKRSATYAAAISTLSLVVIVAAPWVKAWPGADVQLAVVGFGMLFVFALWCFFEALRQAEASRIVPIVGSLIPIFSWLGMYFFLGQSLDGRQALGFFLLIVATVLLTRGQTTVATFATVATRYSAYLFAITAALLFAAASVCGKFAFLHADFLGVFIASRIYAGLTGIVIVCFATDARQEILQMFVQHKKSAKTRAGALMATGQILGSLGFVAVNAAVAQGPVAVVNALQAVQYGAIVLVAWLGGKRLAKLLREDRSRTAFIFKGSALILVAAGLFLIT